MDIPQILLIITPLFSIIFVSALLQKYKYIGDDWSRVLNEFSLKIGLPVLIFYSLAKAPFSFSDQSQLISANSIFIIFCLLLAFITGKVFRLKKQMFRTLFICFVFSNVAYLGIPVLTQVFGKEILPTAGLIIAVYLFWQFTIGTGYLEYSQNANKKDVVNQIMINLCRSPLLLAVILGIIVSSLKIPLPTVILKSLDMITASVTPTVLIVIGLFIGQSKIGKLIEWLPILLFSVLTLFVLPGIFYVGARLFGFAPTIFSSSIIQAAMPLAIAPFALADKYNLDKEFVARSIVLSTILSILSLPFWISILQ